MHSAMEQTRYWMWTRRKLVGKPLNFDPSLTAGSSFGSWEEKAFAADSAGHLGGSIWPPRSYSCSFCAREFRSAQALGGHMNVHRRDRARLKQSTSPVRDDCYSSYHHLNPCTAEGPEYQTQVCPLVYNPNPNTGVAASPLSSKVSMVSSQEKFSKHTSIFQEGREKSLLSNPRYLKDMIAVRQLGDAELKLGRGNWRLNEVGCRGKRNPDEDEDEAPYRKRNKMDSVFPTVARPTSAGQQHLPSEVLKLGPDAVEELDLELRLGDRPTVK